jgi:hypothetical protein
MTHRTIAIAAILSVVALSSVSSAQTRVPVAVGSVYGHVEALDGKLTCTPKTTTTPSKSTIEFTGELDRLQGALTKNRLFAVGKLEAPVVAAPATSPTMCIPDLEKMSGTITFTSELDEKKRTKSNTITDKVTCSLNKDRICTGSVLFAKPNL